MRVPMKKIYFPKESLPETAVSGTFKPMPPSGIRRTFFAWIFYTDNEFCRIVYFGFP